MKKEVNPIIRFQNRPTPLNGIKAKCAECVGCTPTHIEEGFRGQISACSSYSCPLLRYRPYQPKEKVFRPLLGTSAIVGGEV